MANGLFCSQSFRDFLLWHGQCFGKVIPPVFHVELIRQGLFVEILQFENFIEESGVKEQWMTLGIISQISLVYLDSQRPFLFCSPNPTCSAQSLSSRRTSFEARSAVGMMQRQPREHSNSGNPKSTKAVWNGPKDMNLYVSFSGASINTNHRGIGYARKIHHCFQKAYLAFCKAGQGGKAPRTELAAR